MFIPSNSTAILFGGKSCVAIFSTTTAAFV
jgi:hypothetical protein